MQSRKVLLIIEGTTKAVSMKSHDASSLKIFFSSIKKLLTKYICQQFGYADYFLASFTFSTNSLAA